MKITIMTGPCALCGHPPDHELHLRGDHLYCGTEMKEVELTE